MEKKLKISKVLIIDDNADDSQLLETTLGSSKDPKFEIWISGDLRNAKELIQQKHFDVILLDLQLPDSKGLHTVSEIKPLVNSTPIIVLSGLEDESLALEAVHQGVDDYLVKGSFNRSLLMRSIRYAIERKQVQSDLQQAVEHNQQILAAITSILIGVDVDGNVKHWNQIAEKTFGISQDQVIDKPFFEIPISWDIHKAKQIITSHLTKHESTRLPDIAFKRISGQEGLLGFTVNPIWNSNNERTGFLLFGTDVTDRRKSEADQVALQEHVRQRQKMDSLGTLAGGIAHDFKNILGPILGYTEMLLRNTEAETKNYDRLERIQKSALRAKDLIDQILAFSRKGEEKKVATELIDIVDEVVKLLREVFPATIEIETDYLIRDSCILANPTHMHQVVMNLCVNAGYAMRDNSGKLMIAIKEVKVDAAYAKMHQGLELKPYILLTVEDTGAGISPEILPRIFDPFFTTKPIGEGSGLGLAAAHGIVMRHNGVIEVKSQLGKGSVFSVYFPKSKTLQHVDEENKLDVLKGNERILVVDDNSDLVEMMGDMLGSLGYKVQKSISSLDALKLFEEHSTEFDVAIVDQIMPKIIGTKLAAEFKRIRPDFPVILCTGQEDDVTFQNAREIGIKELLEKPVDLSTLTQALRRTLQK